VLVPLLVLLEVPNLGCIGKSHLACLHRDLMGSPLPHLHRDCAQRWLLKHGLDPSISAPGLISPLPHLQ
jgi:hypothetical protein